MGRRYAIDKALLTERPEIEIGDRIYTVDDRMVTFSAMNEALRRVTPFAEIERVIGEPISEDGDGSAFKIIIGYALGKKALGEINGMELSFGAVQRIIVLIQAAMQGISEVDAEKRFQSGAGN